MGIIDEFSQYILNVYNWILGFFNFELFGKNISHEVNGIIQSVICIVIILLLFKILLLKSGSIIGKFIIIVVFVSIYLILNIWIF